MLLTIPGHSEYLDPPVETPLPSHCKCEPCFVCGGQHLEPQWSVDDHGEKFMCYGGEDDKICECINGPRRTD